MAAAEVQIGPTSNHHGGETFTDIHREVSMDGNDMEASNPAMVNELSTTSTEPSNETADNSQQSGQEHSEHLLTIDPMPVDDVKKTVADVLDGMATTLSPPLSNHDQDVPKSENEVDNMSSPRILISEQDDTEEARSPSPQPVSTDDEEEEDRELLNLVHHSSKDELDVEEDEQQLLDQSMASSTHGLMREDEEELLPEEPLELPQPSEDLLLKLDSDEAEAETEAEAEKPTSPEQVELKLEEPAVPVEEEPTPIKPQRGHRRTPSMPVNSIKLDFDPASKTSFTPPVVPRRHKKTHSLVQVEAQLEYNPRAFIEQERQRSKTAEPSVEREEREKKPPVEQDDQEPPVAPARTKKPTKQNDDDDDDEAAQSPKLLDAFEVRSQTSETTTSSSLVTQEQLVAELKDVLKKKKKFVEVVPEGHSRTASPMAYDESFDIASSTSASALTSRTTSPRPPQRTTTPAGQSNVIVITDQPGISALSATSPRRVIELVLVGDEEVPSKLAMGQDAVENLLSFNVEVDGGEVALLVHNNQAKSGQRAVDVADDEVAMFNEAYKKADVVVACFARNNAQTLENLRKRWIPEVRRVRPGIPVVLAAERFEQVASRPVSPPNPFDDEEEPKTNDNATTSEELPLKEINNESLAKVLTLEECQQAARDMGAAAFVEYNKLQQNTDGSVVASQQNEANIRQVFEAAVRAFTAHEAEKLQTASVTVSQLDTQAITIVAAAEPAKQSATMEPRKRCCTIL